MRGQIDVVVTPDVPKLQLSPELCAILAPKAGFADEYNAWLREFFGCTQLLPDGQVAMIDGKAHMNPRTKRMLEDELQRLGRATVPITGARL